ncbi:hypothetical protein BKA70DRAFT_332925 [Coprinopsis sp. MPI-PUGE-AT-0042]|nr:hypothetical protein BKA70DRAFT_332925 [Coprinopsis sp. MPI-PUGE-AT-0042]
MERHRGAEPIWDHDLLRKREKNEKWHPFELRSVHMIQGENEVVGLDDISYLLTPVDGVRCQKRMHRETTVFGIAIIPNDSYLSDTGVKEVRQSFHKLRRAVKYPLELVVCFTNGPQPWYSPTGKDGHLGLRMKSKETQIDFEVRSWDAPCYVRSQNFLERYQLYHCLKFLKDHFNQEAEYCTPEWFITKYREVFRDEDAKKRIIFDRADVDFSFTFADGTAKERRFLRHWASGDLRGRIAEQAEWLLANQIATISRSVQIFNAKVWVAWCERVQRERVKAHEAGDRWGIPPRYELLDLDFPAKDRFGFERFGGTAAIWQEKLSNALKRKPKAKKVVQEEDDKMDVDEEEAQPGTSIRVDHRRPVEFRYDPDFSEDSSSEDEDSDDGWNPPRVNLDLIPRWLFNAWSITPGRFKWECPDPECPFVVDLLNLPEGHELNRIPWTHCNDKPVKLFLTRTVDEHYDDHLWDCGFKWSERRGKRYIQPVKEGEVKTARAVGTHRQPKKRRSR